VIDHVGIDVSDIESAAAFYEQALAPLGYTKLREFPGRDRAGVDAFHDAALAAGAQDDGAPGLRPQYHETYYGAYVLDPEGNNVEAVCHSPE
jgi:catechol 2,3-dioxygenase-like lactoylglutathione lyase family enzyme